MILTQKIIKLLNKSGSKARVLFKIKDYCQVKSFEGFLICYTLKILPFFRTGTKKTTFHGNFLKILFLEIRHKEYKYFPKWVKLDF